MERESDRQRVLIQITQNLAPRIRNSHAFDVPTIYLPHDDDLPCNIPNCIDDVCQQIDKVSGSRGGEECQVRPMRESSRLADRFKRVNCCFDVPMLVRKAYGMVG